MPGAMNNLAGAIMFGMDFNIDGLKDKLAELKDKVKITKEDDGVIVRFTDPAMTKDPSAANLFSPEKIAGLKAMMPDSVGLDFEIEPMEDGFKLNTKDPDGVYDLVSKLLDPELLINMLKQLMEMFTKGGIGGLFNQLGNMGDEEDMADEGDGPEDDDSFPDDADDDDM
jgi:hypothetical protein